MADEKKLRAFRPETFNKRRKVGTIAFADGGTGSIDLPRVGYLAGVWLNFRGTLNLGGAGAFADLGPWNLLKRIQISANYGGAALWDTSGFGAFIASSGSYPNWIADAGDTRSVTPNADVYAAGLANGNNTYSLWYYLPVSLNKGMNFDVGLIMLQSTTVTCTVNLQFGTAVGDVVASLVGGTGMTGNVHVYYDYYEVPDPSEVAQPPLMVVRMLEESKAIQAQGEQLYQVPPGGSLIETAMILRLNSLRVDGFDAIRIYYNKTETRFDMERQWLRMYNRIEQGIHLPTGCFRYDFLTTFAPGLVNVGDSQNAIDTEEISQLEIAPNITGALGGSGNEFRVIRRIVQFVV